MFHLLLRCNCDACCEPRPVSIAMHAKTILVAVHLTPVIFAVHAVTAVSGVLSAAEAVST